jgi:hypothetical protein
MARETKEQKELRWAAEAHIALVAKEAFKATMPARLMKLQALASEASVSTRVLLTEAGPAVEFTRYNYDDRMNDLEETLTYDSEEWEVDHLERRMNSIKEEIDARRQRKALAENLWKDLPTDVKTGLKENIANFR